MTPHVPPTETTVTPLHPQETVLGAIQNALQVAMFGSEGYYCGAGTDHTACAAFADIARLLKMAAGQLGEPNVNAVNAARQIVATGYHGAGADDIDKRWTRDLCAAIISAQLRGPAIVEPQ